MLQFKNCCVYLFYFWIVCPMPEKSGSFLEGSVYAPRHTCMPFWSKHLLREIIRQKVKAEAYFFPSPHTEEKD